LGDHCHVCGQPLDEMYAVACSACGRKIHFESTDSPGTSCGSVITQLYVCGLSFICTPCVDGRSRGPGKAAP
jgi:hypothetical protein